MLDFRQLSFGNKKKQDLRLFSQLNGVFVELIFLLPIFCFLYSHAKNSCDDLLPNINNFNIYRWSILNILLSILTYPSQQQIHLFYLFPSVITHANIAWINSKSFAKITCCTWMLTTRNKFESWNINELNLLLIELFKHSMF